MKAHSMLLLAAALAVAACGGKNKGGTGPSGPSEGDDPATPFNDGVVKERLAAMKNVTECGIDASTTLGAHFESQRAMLKGDGGTVEERFMCRAQPDNSWECEWSVFSVADAEPTPAPDGESVPDEAAPPNPCGAEDPCAGEGGSGYVIHTVVGNDGSVSPGKTSCHAPG